LPKRSFKFWPEPIPDRGESRISYELPYTIFRWRAFEVENI
jgi:hypothetical protein